MTRRVPNQPNRHQAEADGQDQLDRPGGNVVSQAPSALLFCQQELDAGRAEKEADRRRHAAAHNPRGGLDPAGQKTGKRGE